MCALVLIGKSHDTTCSGFDTCYPLGDGYVIGLTLLTSFWIQSRNMNRELLIDGADSVRENLM